MHCESALCPNLSIHGQIRLGSQNSCRKWYFARKDNALLNVLSILRLLQYMTQTRL